MMRKLFGQLDKRYDKEYWARLKRNWKCWKGRRTMETIKEKEEIEQEESEIKEWIDKDDKMGNIGDPYNKLQKNPQDKEP